MTVIAAEEGGIAHTMLVRMPALKWGVLVFAGMCLLGASGCDENKKVLRGDQRYYCNGRVSDRSTSTPLSSVEVSYWDPVGHPGLVTYSDSAGHYRLGLEVFRAGVIRFVKVSYDTATVSVDTVFADDRVFERTLNVGLRRVR